MPGGINGGFFQRGTYCLEGTSIAINIPSVDESLKRIKSSGGKIVKPKCAILDIAFCALVEDTEGNTIDLREDAKR